jgi:hypothetical protein
LIVVIAQSGEQTARSQGVRSSNVRIAAAARGFRFGEKDAVPFLCECSDPNCQRFVPVDLSAYEELFETHEWLLAPGHRADTPDQERSAQGKSDEQT